MLGNLSVAPPSGVAFETSFLIGAPGWSAGDLGGPLSYHFAYAARGAAALVGGGCVAVAAGAEVILAELAAPATALERRLPAGAYDLVLRVSDGATRAAALLPVEVGEKVLDAALATALIADADAAFASNDTSAGVSTLTTTASGLNAGGSNMTTAELEEQREQVMTAMASELDANLEAFDSEAGTEAVAVLVAAVVEDESQVTGTTFDTSILTLGAVVEQRQTSGVSGNTATAVVDAVSSLLVANDASFASGSAGGAGNATAAPAAAATDAQVAARFEGVRDVVAKLATALRAGADVVSTFQTDVRIAPEGAPVVPIWQVAAPITVVSPEVSIAVANRDADAFDGKEFEARCYSYDMLCCICLPCHAMPCHAMPCHAMT